MPPRARALLLVAASAALAPVAAWSATKPSAADFCKREHATCRQTYSCTVGYDAQGQAALDPWYCKKCRTKLDDCLAIAGLSSTERRASTSRARAAAARKEDEFGMKTPDHQLKDPKFGTELARSAKTHQLGGVRKDEAAAEAKPRQRDRDKKRPASSDQ
jgi:hypothetical protein